VSLVKSREIPDRHEMVVTIGKLRRRHLRQVMRIENQVYPKPWTLGIFNGELALGDQRLYLVAKVGSVVVGYLGAMYSDEDVHITNVAVDPKWQRHQIATRLMVTAVQLSIAKGTNAMTLEVRVTNVAAQEMYRRFGLAPAGIRRRYYENTEDAVVMWAHDLDSSDYRVRLEQLWDGLAGDTVADSEIEALLVGRS
jgi:[ribosomal protein S18]-alanine N-acetyltransferase